MPLNGTGTFAPIEPEFPAIPETTILASEFNTIITDISEALSLSLYKDGQAVVLADIDWGDNKIVNLATGVNDKDAVNFDQVFHNPTFVGSLADGIILSGTKTTINSTLLEINSDTVEIDSANIGIHASDNLLLDSDSILNIESPSITLDALNDINLLSALTTINSPNIVLTGNTLATLNTNTTAVTQPLADSSTKLATTEYVTNRAFSATLPGQAGNAGALLSTNGTTGYWTKTISGITINQVDNDFTFQDDADPTKKAKFECFNISPGQTRLISFPDTNAMLVGTGAVQTLTNKTILQKDSLFTLQDDVDGTKQAKFECSSIATGTTRIITIPNEDITLGDSTKRLLQTFTSPGVGLIWEILPTTIDNTYDIYEFELYGLQNTVAGTDISLQFKAGASYLTSGYSSGGSPFVNGSILFVTSAGINPASNNYAYGRLRIYRPWSATLRKAGIYNLSQADGFDDPSIDIGFSHNSLLAFTGFKYTITSGVLIAGAVGKWYGLK